MAAPALLAHPDLPEPYETSVAPGPGDQGAAPANPLAPVLRAMRGRWLGWFALCALLGSGLGAAGYLTGTQIYESQSILRVHPRENSILDGGRDDSIIKTYDSFIKAETAFVASPDVFARAAEALQAEFPDLTDGMRPKDLRDSVEIKRSESLIVLKTSSKVAEFAAAKLRAVTDAYLGLTADRRDALSRHRTAELAAREIDLLANLRQLDRRRLEVGGEYGAGAIIKAHVEKVSQIEALSNRRAEVMRTLEAMRRSDGKASADMNDDQILRATLLDRGLADLNIEIARARAELAALMLRYTEDARIVQDKLHQIDILVEAQTARREQIQVLGQTGALTDQSDGGEEQSIEAIERVMDKVTTDLEETRLEARSLNARRVELTFLEEERDENRRMLDETRTALDRVRVESRTASPGLVDLMSPAVMPDAPADDSSKMRAALGLAGGGFLASLLVLGRGLTDRRLRWSDELDAGAVPVLVAQPHMLDTPSAARAHAMDRLRTRLQLRPRPAADGTRPRRALCIAVLRAGPGDAAALARDLAESFARTDLRVLYIDADIAAPASGGAGWRDRISGGHAAATPEGGLYVLPAGSLPDAPVALSLPRLREQITTLSRGCDVIVLHGGSLRDNACAPLLGSVSDFLVAQARRGDHRAETRDVLASVSGHGRFGNGVVFTGAQPSDPAVRQ